MPAPPTSRLPRAIAIAAVIGIAVAGIAPRWARAEDTARISRLESEIQLLRTQIDEQNRRIQRLEAELARRGDGVAVLPRPTRHVDAKTTDRPVPTARQPWHSPEAWNRVAKGMAVGEVRTLLGEPTAVESVGALKTLFYRGAAAGGTAVNGHVNLRDDRVVAVSKPAFQAAPSP